MSKTCLLKLWDLVWAQGWSDPACGWLVLHTTTLICHFWDCELQLSSVRQQAGTDTHSNIPVHPQPAINPPSTYPQMPLAPWPVIAKASGSHLTAPPSFQFTNFTLTSSLVLYSQSMYPPSANGSVPSTQAPSPAFSDVTQSSQLSKQLCCSDSFLSVNQVPFPGYNPEWSKGEQALFEMSVAHLTASAGLLLWWVENR